MTETGPLSVVYEGIEGRYMVFSDTNNTRMIFADGGLNSNGEGAVIVAPTELLPDYSVIAMGSQEEKDFFQTYAENQLAI